MVVLINRNQPNNQKQVSSSCIITPRFGAHWPNRSLQNGPKLKIPNGLQFLIFKFVNDFKLHKWLF